MVYQSAVTSLSSNRLIATIPVKKTW